MGDIDGGLHPAVDGQSLDEDEDEERPLDMEMVISATHKTIGHQTQAATWTDKGRLQKIKIKRKPCNRRSKILAKR